jgi:hypothetical protein
MNFFKDRELAQRLRNNQVSEKEKFIYLLINLMAISIASCLPSSEIIEELLYLSLTIIGTIFCYKVNAKGDNQNYIERYISLGVPIAIQVIILMIPFSFILSFLFIKFSSIIGNNENIEVIINTSIFECYFFWRLYGSIKIASGQ